MATLFHTIKDGCADFVAQVHTTQSQNRLLYGLVPNETIASLVLDIARRTLKLKSLQPEIAVPYRLYPKFVKISVLFLILKIKFGSKFDDGLDSVVNGRFS